MQKPGWGPRKLLSSQALSRPCLPAIFAEWYTIWVASCMEFLMFASQECSSACVAPFSYGNWSSMSCSSSYQLSRPCLSFCWVIQVVWSFKVCFSGSHTCQVVLLHFDPLDWTGATWVVLPLISWNGNTESSSWNLSVGKNCFRSLMFLFFKPNTRLRSSDGQSQWIPQSESWAQIELEPDCFCWRSLE